MPNDFINFRFIHDSKFLTINSDFTTSKGNMLMTNDFINQ